MKKNKFLELSSSVGLNLKAEQDLEKIVQMVTRFATHILEAKSGAFKYILKNEKGEEQDLYARSGAWQGSYTHIGETLLKSRLDSHRIVRIDDVTKVAGLTSADTEAREFPVGAHDFQNWQSLGRNVFCSS